MTRRPCNLIGLAAALAGLTLVGGCETTKIGDCAPGTTRVAGACVPSADLCGPGTTYSAGVCVADDVVGGDTGACVPDCTDRVCGPDGCDGFCGSCGEGEGCSPAGVCEALVTCVPDCAGRECGDDGCGGVCASCTDPTRSVCEAATGTCVAACIPDCVARACGDDGCGGTCGSCDVGSACSILGHCVPGGWTCAAPLYGTRDQCDCGCGIQDPDCAVPSLALVGCDPDDTCVDGACQPRVPVAWTCAGLAYDDGILCDCGCGAPDPDCDGVLPVNGCDAGETCGAAGACVVCVADCTGKVCGNDGCGGSCGACPQDGQACVAGACVEGCYPSPLLCETNSCGDDGCGGSCGDCPANTFCGGDRCVVNPGFSCAGRCGVAAPGGCGCDQGCVGQGDCCPDYVAECVCLPDCAGKSCGGDGCGGTCGSCSGGTPYCGPTGQCAASCAPSCGAAECGDDGCGGSCGDCGAGESCNAGGLCTPATWSCADFYYGDGGVCDCGCGAPDPDCAQIGLTTGCPLGAECNDASGFCEIAFCSATSDCAAPAWCVGHYLAGAARQRGVCQPPEPAGQPAGATCWSDYGCASGLCAGGLCRDHCGDDGDCGAGAVCLGVALVDALSLDPLGVVTVCDSLARAGETCASQAACGANETCLAFIDPATLGASYRCGVLPDGLEDENQPCEGSWVCTEGLTCVGGQCMRPCPGGQADCPPSSTCGAGVLHGGASPLGSDDVLADICVPD